MIDIILYNIDNGYERTYPKDSNINTEYEVDPRDLVIENFNIEDDNFRNYYANKYIEFITYKSNMALYCFFKPTELSRGNDGHGGVIAIPSDTDISGVELVELIKKMRKELDRGIINEEELDNIKRDYGICNGSKCKNSWDNKKYAFQIYSDYSQIRDNMFSACYTSYKAVFILDEDNKLLKGDVKKLDNNIIKNNCEEQEAGSSEENPEETEKGKLLHYFIMLLIVSCFSIFGFFAGKIITQEKDEIYYSAQIDSLKQDCWVRDTTIMQLEKKIDSLDNIIIGNSSNLSVIKELKRENNKLQADLNRKKTEISNLNDTIQYFKNRIKVLQ
mgnify:CR=1 FL=1